MPVPGSPCNLLHTLLKVFHSSTSSSSTHPFFTPGCTIHPPPHSLTVAHRNVTNEERLISTP